MHTASRASLDASLALGNLTNFTKWSTTKTVFTPYKYAVELAGCNGTPMSAYFPIIIALKNDFDTALANPEFDGVLGPNTSALLADAVKIDSTSVVRSLQGHTLSDFWTHISCGQLLWTHFLDASISTGTV